MSQHDGFESRHKYGVNSFTRTRKLPFNTVLQLLLRKGVKSAQLALNEWCEDLDEQITASALSQARQKFRHTAFIELLEKAVVEVMYGDDDYKKFRGRRLLAIDCSSLRLPDTRETRQKFSKVSHRDARGKTCGEQVEGKASVLYDVLNNIPLSAQLCPGRVHDLPASQSHLVNLKEGDVIVVDRAFGASVFFAQIVARNADFVVRCKRRAWEAYHNLFVDGGKKEVITTLRVSEGGEEVAPIRELKVRFIRIELADGEVEVLVTSLINQKKYPRKLFKALYYKRWNIETYFQTLKSRLSIDNFSGKSVESIYQDFYSTIYVSGLETMLRMEADDELAARDTKHQYKVNKAVSFHTIKNKVVGLLFAQPPDFERQIKALLLQNPVSIRPERVKTRLKQDNSVKSRASAYFQKCARKHVF